MSKTFTYSSKSTESTEKDADGVSDALLDFDWDPHYCLHNPAQNRQTKPKFTIGADDLADDDPPTAPRHRPPFTRRHAAVSLTDNGGINTKYSLTMAMMDDSISDESLIKLLEDAVIFIQFSVFGEKEEEAPMLAVE